MKKFLLFGLLTTGIIGLTACKKEQELELKEDVIEEDTTEVTEEKSEVVVPTAEEKIEEVIAYPVPGEDMLATYEEPQLIIWPEAIPQLVPVAREETELEILSKLVLVSSYDELVVLKNSIESKISAIHTRLKEEDPTVSFESIFELYDQVAVVHAQMKLMEA